jgi:hypothetical protein
LQGKGWKEESFQRSGKDSHRVTEDTERRNGRKRRELLSAAKEAAGRLFDQAVGED